MIGAEGLNYREKTPCKIAKPALYTRAFQKSVMFAVTLNKYLIRIICPAATLILSLRYAPSRSKVTTVLPRFLYTIHTH